MRDSEIVEASQWRSPTVIALVLANLVPLYGVIVLRWEVFPIMLLFWLENVVVGIFNVLRMLWVVSANPRQPKLFFIPFFCVHYGGFTFVHGIFVVLLFGGGFTRGAPFPNLGALQEKLAGEHLGWALLALAGSHAFEFFWHYLRRGEYRTASLDSLMLRPYGRVVVLHLVILGGGFALTKWHSPAIGLALLVVLKTVLDLCAHLRERRQHASRKPLSNPAAIVPAR